MDNPQENNTNLKSVMPGVEDIIRFENGEMLEKEEVVNFFQGLIDSGMVWQLQGSYGRMAMRLAEEGLVDITK